MQKLKWVLAGSLVLNLFLIGGLAGGAYKMLHNNGAKNTTALRFAANNLSLEQKRNFIKAIQQARTSALPLQIKSAEARTEAINQISKPDFDRVAIEAALNKVREADKAVRLNVESALLDYAERLNPADRATLSLGLSKSGPFRQPPMLIRNKMED